MVERHGAGEVDQRRLLRAVPGPAGARRARLQRNGAFESHRAGQSIESGIAESVGPGEDSWFHEEVLLDLLAAPDQIGDDPRRLIVVAVLGHPELVDWLRPPAVDRTLYEM